MQGRTKRKRESRDSAFAARASTSKRAKRTHPKSKSKRPHT